MMRGRRLTLDISAKPEDTVLPTISERSPRPASLTSASDGSEYCQTPMTPPPISRFRTRPLERLHRHSVCQRQRGESATMHSASSSESIFSFRQNSHHRRARSHFERLVFFIWVMSFVRCVRTSRVCLMFLAMVHCHSMAERSLYSAKGE